MSDYLLIESRDPFECGYSHYQHLAGNLAKSGKKVTLFLVQNAVFPTRPCSFSQSLIDIANAGVEVLADNFSLQERGIDPGILVDGVQAASLEIVIEHMVNGRKVLWH